eukprot:302924-Amphidinium_carterae.1
MSGIGCTQAEVARLVHMPTNRRAKCCQNCVQSKQRRVQTCKKCGVKIEGKRGEVSRLCGACTA